MGYRDFLEQQTADWEKISEELRAQEEHADRIHDYNMRLVWVFSVIGFATIAGTLTLWVITRHHLWIPASLLGPFVVLFGYPIFKKDYD